MKITNLLKRLRLVISEGRPLTSSEEAAVRMEMAGLGYLFTQESQMKESILQDMRVIIPTLQEMKGDNGKWVPLHGGFPEAIPEDYYIRRFLGYLLGNNEEIQELLFSDGFGADPVTQMRRGDLFNSALSAQKEREGDTHTVWHHLECVGREVAEQRYQNYYESLLYGKAIPSYLWEEVVDFIREGGRISPERISFKENKALLGKYLWEKKEWERVVGLVSQPTDLLRILAAVADGDISLVKPLRLPKFPRAMRRLIVGRLDSLREDVLLSNLMMKRDLWKYVLKSLHVGEYKQNVNIQKVARLVRDGNYTYRGWRSHVETALLQREIPLDLLREQPTMFARKLRHVLSMSPTPSRIALAFLQVAKDVPCDVLLKLAHYLGEDRDRGDRMVVFKNGAMKLLEGNPHALSLGAEMREQMLGVVRYQLSSLPPMGKVYIDPKLFYVLAPLKERGASESLISLPRGSVMPLTGGKTLRFFTYWEQETESCRVDIDLSALFLSSSWEVLGRCSWSATASEGATHSGDIQSAPPPLGGFEAMDINIPLLLGRGVRYVVPGSLVYCGRNIKEAFTGWMEREGTSSNYKTFDPKTVANKVNLDTKRLEKSSSYGILIDIKQNLIYVADLYMRSRNVIEECATTLIPQLKYVEGLHEEYPTMGQLISLNVEARGGEIVLDEKEADTVYDLSSLGSINTLLP